MNTKLVVNSEYIAVNENKYYFSDLSLINISEGKSKDKEDIYIVELFGKSDKNAKVCTLYPLRNQSNSDNFMKILCKDAKMKGVKCTFYKRPALSDLGGCALLMLICFTIIIGFFCLYSLSEFGKIIGLPPFVVIVYIASIIIYALEQATYSDNNKNSYQYYMNVEKQLAQNKVNAEKRVQEIKYEKYLAENKSPESWNPYIAKPCPHCGHYKVRSAKWDDKKMSVAFWGIHSQKIGKQYICDNCKNMW